jgi:beta-glucosidase-like glycosyl hydrolase
MALAKARDGISVFVDTVVREARGVGIHIAFAPVADVNTNRRNPIISIRAFGEDPQRAAELTARYVTLAESAGLLTTAKHFPGHGDTHQDSHDSLPSVAKSLDELCKCELLPFQAAIDAGCSLVMTAHVAFPRIDPSGRPATLCPILLQDMLRGDMGFQGVVCSDSLLMAGVRDLFANEGEMALAALDAGVDLLLDVKDPVAVVDYLCACVDVGKLDSARVDEAFARVWALKQKAYGPPIIVTTLDQPAESEAAAIAREATEVLGSNYDVACQLPLKSDRPLVAVLIKPFELPWDTEQPFGDAVRQRFGRAEYLELGPRADDEDLRSAYTLASAAPQLVVAMIVRPAAWHAFGLLPPQREFVRRLTAERPVVLASLGVPYALDDYPDAAVRICTYSDVAVSQRALVDVLLTECLAR